MSDQGKDPEHEVWQPSKPPPPMPDFPEIPAELKKAAQDPAEKAKSSPIAGLATGWALALDFVGTIIASWLIGFGIDWWQKTNPWGTLIGLGVGFAYAIVRILKQTQEAERRNSRK